MKLFLQFTFLLIIVGSCNSGVSTKEELLTFINSNQDSFVRTKRVNKFNISVKYLPPQFFVLKELSGGHSPKSKVVDSLMNIYGNSRTFLLTVSSDETAENPIKDNVMFYGSESIQEYKERAVQMNFTMEDQFRLKTENGEFFPVLCNLENTYSAVGHKNFLIVFADTDSNQGLMAAKNLDFVFTDEFFNTGINHFVFDKEQIDDVPTLVF